MSERWLDSSSDGHAAARAETFWAALSENIDAGAFWADRIKRYRGEPGKRLETAMDNLPLPAAFREAAVALRAIIRGKRKAKASYEEELGLLYWLAAIESFMLPYSERLKEPGFNVIESIPGCRLRSLPVEYRTLGYERLGLLNQTDKKWLTEAWGEPESHMTLNQVYRALWDEYEQKLVQRRRAERDASIADLRDLIEPARRPSDPRVAKKPAGCLGMMLIMLAVALAATSWLASWLGR